MIDLNELAKKVHANSVEKGFWEGDPSDQHFLCLVISELMEAVEADRKSLVADKQKFNEWMLSGNPHRHVFENAFEKWIKDSVSDELSDAFIRLLDLAGARNLNMNRINFTNIVSKNKTFTENIYSIIKDLMNNRYSLEEQIFYCLSQISMLAEILEIPLSWHVEQKMKYNQLREYKHGKKY